MADVVTFESLSSYTVSGNSTSTIILSPISQSYTDLFVSIEGLMSTSSGVNLIYRFNSDSGIRYSRNGFWVDSTSSGGFNSANQNVAYGGVFTNTKRTNEIMHIFNYSTSAVTNVPKNRYILSKSMDIGDISHAVQVNEWRNTTDGITSITFSFDGGGTFANGTIIALYGIKSN